MKRLTWVVLAALAAATPGLAQSLQVTATVGGVSTNVSSGGTVALTAVDIGQPALATITVQNTGATAVSLTGVTLAGAAELTLASAPSFPVNLNPNTGISFSVQYLPSTGNAATAQVSIAFVANNQAGLASRSAMLSFRAARSPI
jgi:hypothetical protein